MKRYIIVKDNGTDIMNHLKEDGTVDYVSLGFHHIDVFFPNGAVYDTQHIEAAGLTRHFTSLIHYGRATDTDTKPSSTVEPKTEDEEKTEKRAYNKRNN